MVSRKPVEEYFQYVERHRIDHLEIDLKKKHSLLNTFTPERIKMIREWSQSCGVSISLHPPFNMNLCSRIRTVRRFHTHYLRKSIQLASRLGAGHLTLHLGNFYRFAIWANPRIHALERLVRVLRQIVPEAEASGVKLALENMIPIPPEAGYMFLGDNIQDFHYIFQHIQSPALVFCLDIGHANVAEGSLKYVEKLGEKLVSAHFHDNKGEYDDHLNVGEGTVPWQNLMKAFKTINFNGPFISECVYSEHHESIEALKKKVP